VHEWALAEAVLESVRAEQQSRPGEQARQVVIQFGELQSIDPEVFAEGITHLQHDAGDMDLQFVFETEPATLKCNACGHGWAFSECEIDEATREAIHFLPEVAHSFLVCPSCGSADFRIDRGRGVTIRSIEFEAQDGDGNPPAAGDGPVGERP
jgi:hydrogenase nickel incorporation protein HypA/HybF